jgi:hypothetical protein
MPKFLIEREIPGAGKLTAEDLNGLSQKSCGVLKSMGPDIQWVHSYVTADKVYCVYIAPNAEAVHEHARQGGFPANSVTQITTIIDPTTAEWAQFSWVRDDVDIFNPLQVLLKTSTQRSNCTSFVHHIQRFSGLEAAAPALADASCSFLAEDPIS